LFQVVRTLHAVGRLPNLLHGREEQPDQDGNDGNDDEQFDQGEGGSPSETDWNGTHDAPPNDGDGSMKAQVAPTTRTQRWAGRKSANGRSNYRPVRTGAESFGPDDGLRRRVRRPCEKDGVHKRQN